MYILCYQDNLMRHSMKHMKSIAEQDPNAPKALFPFAPQDLLQPPNHQAESEEPETMLEERSDEETVGPSDDHSPDQGMRNSVVSSGYVTFRSKSG